MKDWPVVYNRLIYLCYQRGNYWFRLCNNGPGIGLRDHRRFSPLLSEREGFGRDRHIHIGPWCIALLARVRTSK